MGRGATVDSVHSCLTLNWLHLAGRIISLSWHPSGTQIAAGMMDMIKIFDTETGEEDL